jgi:hypothetical protein
MAVFGTVLQSGWLLLVWCYIVDDCFWYGATVWMAVFGMVLQCGWLFWYGATVWMAVFGMVLQSGWLGLIWCYSVDSFV